MGTSFILMGFGMLFFVWLRRRRRWLEPWDVAVESDGTPHRTSAMATAVGADMGRNRNDESGQQGIDMYELNDAAKAAAALEEGARQPPMAEPRRAKTERVKASEAEDFDMDD